MALTSLTDEQAAIVSADDVDIAVSAGAGSGKTHVLVERYVHLLQHAGIPEIVAVTFTEAAAAEMRQRVRREVMQRPDLERHRRDVDDAVVGTIHSLCLRLLREYPVEAGLDPAADVLADDEAELLRQIAATEAIDEAAESGDERTGALRALGVWATTSQLPQMLAQRDEVRDAFAAMPGDTAEEWAAAVRARLDDACREVVEPLRRRTVETFAEVWRECDDRSDLLATKAAAAEALFGDPMAGDWSDWRSRALAGANAINLQGGRAKSWIADVTDVKQLLGGLRDEIRIRLADTPAWNDYDEVAMAALPGLRALFEDACERYRRAKAERHSLDFLDLEIEAVRLLEEHPAVADACRRRFRHVMVDEAQDVSPIQERLIRRIVGEGEGRPRLFLVGDAKQSIYAFRGADVRRFTALRDIVRQWGGELLPLSASFRTHSVLVTHNNALFGSVFEDGAGGVEMEPMSGRPSEPPDGPHLTLIPIGKSDADRSDNTKRRVEAELVALEIRRVLDEGRLVWDKRLREYRRAEPRDVALLLRRFTNVHIFEQALETHDIPYATPSGTGFYSRSEVVDLGNLLRWLAEPDDQIALMAVLRSPMFVLADDTLLALRGGTSRPFIVALADPPEGLDPSEAGRCRLAAEILDELRRAAGTASAADLLDLALERTGYEASWAPVSGGEQVLANVRKLLRIVRGLASYPLNRVVEYLAQRRDDQLGREGPAILDRRNAVQIMTVHGAKGLEFPVVFVPEGHVAAFASNETIRWRREDGVSFTLDDRDGDRRQQPGFHAFLKSRNSVDEAQEHLRLFYVAATRAGDYLYLSGNESTAEAWLPAASAAHSAGLLDGIDVRPTVPADRSLIAEQQTPSTVEVPNAALAQPYTPPLMERPLVIPLRASTPATGFRLAEVPHWGGHGDGLGRLRGTIAHRAIELAYTTGGDVDLVALARGEGADLLAVETLATLVAEVDEMLTRFRVSEIGRAIARPEAQARFEAPFAWDWDGVPVHGTVDLLYRDVATDEWHVVDFKTDRVVSGRTAEAAAPYLVQIGLYAGALEAATGERPRAGLLFLRTGEWYEAPPEAITNALAEARRRIDEGTIADDTSDPAVALEDDA